MCVVDGKVQIPRDSSSEDGHIARERPGHFSGGLQLDISLGQTRFGLTLKWLTQDGTSVHFVFPQRNHTPQKVPSVRDLENMAPPPPHVQNYTARPEHRNHLSGRQAERSPPQTLRSDSIPTHGEPHLNRSLALDQSPGQHSERITPQQGQQYDWNPARCPSTEWNPNLSQTMRNPTQSQTVVRNPNQYGQAMHGTVQSQASDRNPATGNYKPFTQDKGQSTTQQNGGAIFSTETTV